MKFIRALSFLIAALFTQGAWAAPVVVASQSTATSGMNHVVAVPAGAVGDLLVGVVAGDYMKMAARFYTTAGWTSRSNPFCGRASGLYYKVSDGTETSLTVTSNQSISGQAWVLRVTGYNPIPPPTAAVPGPYGLNSRAYNYSPGEIYQDPPNIIMPAVVDTLWVVGAFNNGGSPSLYPSGYGFSLDAANTARLVLAFKSAVAYSDDPGIFTLPAAVKGCVFGFGVY